MIISPCQTVLAQMLAAKNGRHRNWTIHESFEVEADLIRSSMKPCFCFCCCCCCRRNHHRCFLFLLLLLAFLLVLFLSIVVILVLFFLTLLLNRHLFLHPSLSYCFFWRVCRRHVDVDQYDTSEHVSCATAASLMRTPRPASKPLGCTRPFRKPVRERILSPCHARATPSIDCISGCRKFSNACSNPFTHTHTCAILPLIEIFLNVLRIS